MLELKNVSKFYYKKGMITTGFSRINLKFDMGEFVAITGESGSGKSTLLNVISGMDTYEEGELLIDGNPTSHYIQSDWEEYREKYHAYLKEIAEKYVQSGQFEKTVDKLCKVIDSYVKSDSTSFDGYDA